MHIVVYENQEARLVLVLSDAMNIKAVSIGSLRNETMIDNTGGCWKGMSKRFYQRKGIMNTILWAMITSLLQIH
jgi:hypothetical protein